MAQELQLVVFKLAGEEYGIPINKVQEIDRLTEITRLPQTPAFMEGVINFRDGVIPILDLRKRFGLTAVKTSETRVIIVEVEGQILAVIVDGVDEVLTITDDEIGPPPASFIMDAKFLLGLGKVSDRIIIILNINKILTSKEQEILKTLHA